VNLSQQPPDLEALGARVAEMGEELARTMAELRALEAPDDDSWSIRSYRRRPSRRPAA
jgi:hypothetical protein